VTGRRYARLAFLFVLAVCVLQAMVYYPKLPQLLASHFNAAGRANGWSSKEMFFGLQGFIVCLLTAFFWLFPAQLHRFPDRLINLPHKDYWLAPERRAATLAAVGDALTWFGCAALLLMLGVTQLVIQYNLQQAAALPQSSMWTLIGGFALCAVLLTARLLLFTRRPRA